MKVAPTTAGNVCWRAAMGSALQPCYLLLCPLEAQLGVVTLSLGLAELSVCLLSNRRIFLYSFSQFAINCGVNN